MLTFLFQDLSQKGYVTRCGAFSAQHVRCVVYAHIQHFTLRKATVYMSCDGFLLEKDLLDF